MNKKPNRPPTIEDIASGVAITEAPPPLPPAIIVERLKEIEGGAYIEHLLLRAGDALLAGEKRIRQLENGLRVLLDLYSDHFDDTMVRIATEALGEEYEVVNGNWQRKRK